MCSIFIRETKEELLPGIEYKITWSYCNCYADNYIKYKADAFSVDTSLNHYINSVWTSSPIIGEIRETLKSYLEYRVNEYKINLNIQTKLF